MSRRRRSGTALLEGAEEIAQLQLQQHEDFRRRHSRQNREIIADNITRNRTIRSLSEQVHCLQAELLAERRQNLIMRRRLVEMRDAQRTLRGDIAIEALDSLLAAIPGLQQIRDALAASSLPDIPKLPDAPPTMPKFGFATATRPAALAADNMGLNTLDEVAEEPSPEKWKRRNSHTSPSRDSPRRMLFKTAVNKTGSLSPKRTPPRKSRKRRESGLLPIRTFAEELDGSPAASPARKESAYGEHADVEEAEKSGEFLEEDLVEATITPKVVHRTHSSKVKNLAAHYEEKERLAAEQTPSPVPSPTATITVRGPRVVPTAPSTVPSTVAVAAPISTVPAKSSKGVPVPKLEEDDDGFSTCSTLSPPPDSPQPLPPALAVAPTAIAAPSRPAKPSAKQSFAPTERAAETPSVSPPPSLPTEEPESAEEDGTRGRRTRKVVSYKEPSLNKKMRKPDGAVVDDLLGVMNRSDTTVGGVRRKSALPRSTRTLAPPSELLMGDEMDEIVIKEEGDKLPKVPKASLSSSGGSTSSTGSTSSGPSSTGTTPAAVTSSARTKTAGSALKPAAEKARRISPAPRTALTDLDGPNVAVSNGSAATGIPAPREPARKTATAAEKRRRSAAV